VTADVNITDNLSGSEEPDQHEHVRNVVADAVTRTAGFNRRSRASKARAVFKSKRDQASPWPDECKHKAC